MRSCSVWNSRTSKYRNNTGEEKPYLAMHYKANSVLWEALNVVGKQKRHGAGGPDCTVRVTEFSLPIAA
jgi:hypothetical protein